MRICLFGQGPLCDAVEAALEVQGHTLLGPFDSPQPTEVLKATQASVGLSCGYRHKLKPEEWGCFPDGILNLHTGYLPWNKGAYPNVWPILDGSPAGVTLHRVDAGIDTGPILAQRLVQVEPFDTAKTLYDKLLLSAVDLIEQEVHKADSFGWEDGVPQLAGTGSRHFKTETAQSPAPEFKTGDPDCFLDVIHTLRAYTFPGYGLRYRQDGKLLEATITITEVTE